MPKKAEDRLEAATNWVRQQRGKAKPLAAPVGETVDRVLAKTGLARRVAQASVIEEWAGLVGPQIAAVTQAESVTADGVLWVRVASASWATELGLMTPKILARVNADRKGRVKSIRWVPR